MTPIRSGRLNTPPGIGAPSARRLGLTLLDEVQRSLILAEQTIGTALAWSAGAGRAAGTDLVSGLAGVRRSGRFGFGPGALILGSIFDLPDSLADREHATGWQWDVPDGGIHR